MQLIEVDTALLQLSALQSSKGVKTANASYRGGPCDFLLHGSEWFVAPFGASAYQDPTATRLTMELDVTNSSVLPALQVMDAWVVQYVIKNGVFESLSAEEVARMYHSCLQTSEKYSSIRLRTKLNTAGLHACQFFKSPEKTPLDFKSVDLKASRLRPVIRFKGIWKQIGMWGLSFEVLKALVDTEGTNSWDY